MPEDRVVYQPIGVIHTQFTNTDQTPIQGVFARGAKGEVELFPEYTAGLKDIDGFSHIILLYHCHLSTGFSLITKPFLEDKPHGLFSIRHFNRPNPIGLSVVKLDKVMKNILEISEVDIIDGTPILDIKPFVPLFDNRPNARSGWLSNPHINMVKGEVGNHRSE